MNGPKSTEMGSTQQPADEQNLINTQGSENATYLRRTNLSGLLFKRRAEQREAGKGEPFKSSEF
jgi:hypothetical protein